MHNDQQRPCPLTVVLVLTAALQACGGTARETPPSSASGSGAAPALWAGSGGKEASDGSSGAAGVSVPGGSSGAGGAVIGSNDGCSPFGLQFTPDCTACPTEPVECRCGPSAIFALAPRCSAWGQCLESVDCLGICAALGANGGPDAFSQIYAAVTDCLAQRSCQSDAECSGGKCFRKQAAQAGTCSHATTDSPCLTASDCFSGICVINGDRGACQDGRLGQPCGSAADCDSKICATSGIYFGNGAPLQPAARSQTGTALTAVRGGKQCQSGGVGASCEAAGDCSSALCVVIPGAPPQPPGGASGLGMCQDGAAGSPCNHDADCKLGTCLVPSAAASPVGGAPPLGWCSAGNPGEFCTTNADCQSGSCHATSQSPATCYNGALHDPCGSDGECQSGMCAQAMGPGTLGSCSSGAVGDPCGNDDQCTNHLCIVPPNPTVYGFSYKCSAGSNGDLCWLDDDCQSGICGTLPGKDQGQCQAP